MLAVTFNLIKASNKRVKDCAQIELVHIRRDQTSMFVGHSQCLKALRDKRRMEHRGNHCPFACVSGNLPETESVCTVINQLPWYRCCTEIL